MAGQKIFWHTLVVQNLARVGWFNNIFVTTYYRYYYSAISIYWLFYKDRFSIYYIKSFNLVTLCDLVTVFAETKSVTKSRLHCSLLTQFVYSPFNNTAIKWSWKKFRNLQSFQLVCMKNLKASPPKQIIWILHYQII